jgi:hypothetical protein
MLRLDPQLRRIETKLQRGRARQSGGIFSISHMRDDGRDVREERRSSWPHQIAAVGFRYAWLAIRRAEVLTVTTPNALIRRHDRFDSTHRRVAQRSGTRGD